MHHEVAIGLRSRRHGEVIRVGFGDQYEHAARGECDPDVVGGITESATADDDDVGVPFAAARPERDEQFFHGAMAFENADPVDPSQHGFQSAAKDLQ
ncbi:hypothetical protein [Streptosporangium nondiastaticum]|uniref:hypothetical protein n=1 Tax=Streptosporangium nondiastaticum TaxID=35764 RepID=UPI0016785B2B|nr:hypothetical protein [Streptosporangium nondiastaticum]